MNAAGEVFEGLAVVVTVPIGCLKAHDIDFQPALPPWKQEAIDRMGNGNLNKACAPLELSDLDPYATLHGCPPRNGKC